MGDAADVTADSSAVHVIVPDSATEGCGQTPAAIADGARPRQAAKLGRSVTTPSYNR
jgi:hypothetical protein